MITTKMRELQERCETLCKREGEELFCDTMVEFELLKDRVERATVRLKVNLLSLYSLQLLSQVCTPKFYVTNISAQLVGQE